MKLTDEQEAAVAAAVDVLAPGGGGMLKICGPAGSGKTTLLGELIRRGGADAAVLAPTNRAAAVLRSKGAPEATTVHSACCLPVVVALHAEIEGVEKALAAGPLPAVRDALQARRADLLDRLAAAPPGGEEVSFDFRDPNSLADRPLLVDEGSMIGEEMLGWLRQSTGRGIVLIGDESQLPPVGDEPAWHGLPADVVLGRIHRTARESPIIAVATAVREGDEPRARRLAEAAGIIRGGPIAPVLSAEDAVEIVWRNERKRPGQRGWFRNERNAAHRAADCRGDWLEPGEPIIALQNWRANGIPNGTIYRVLSIGGEVRPGEKDRWRGPTYAAAVEPDGEPGKVIGVRIGREPGDGPGRLAEGSGWAHARAITCHRAQGGEWAKATVLDDFAIPGEDRRRWLYTSLTRSRSELRWVPARS